VKRLALAIELTCARPSRALVGIFGLHLVNLSVMLFYRILPPNENEYLEFKYSVENF
jgi:hypothetical protein